MTCKRVTHSRLPAVVHSVLFFSFSFVQTTTRLQNKGVTQRSRLNVSEQHESNTRDAQQADYSISNTDSLLLLVVFASECLNKKSLRAVDVRRTACPLPVFVEMIGKENKEHTSCANSISPQLDSQQDVTPDASGQRRWGGGEQTGHGRGVSVPPCVLSFLSPFPLLCLFLGTREARRQPLPVNDVGTRRSFPRLLAAVVLEAVSHREVEP